jgi:hypothetical protein
MNKNLIGLLIAAAVCIGGYALHITPVAVIGGIGFAAFFVVSFREQSKQDAIGRAKIVDTDKQLRNDLVATLTRSFTELADADDATKAKVAELFAEAGKHLGDPYTNSRVVYGTGYFVNWNQAGIDLVTQAKQVIDAHVAARKA